MGRIKQLFKNLKSLTKYDLRDSGWSRITYAEAVENTLYYIPNSAVVRPNVMDAYETLDMLCNTNKSIARFGDGEIGIINGRGISFQEYDPVLAARMREMLLNKDENILIGINWSYFYPVFDATLSRSVMNFHLYSMPHCRRELLKLINTTTQYCDAGFTGLRTVKSAKTDAFYDKIRTIWAGRDIVVLGNPQLRAKIQHDIFDNARSQTHIDVPNKNSWDVYAETLDKLKQFSTDTLIILIAGPLSKVLVGDLSPLGYRALDLGHIAKAYDWYCTNKELSDADLKSFYKIDS